MQWNLEEEEEHSDTAQGQKDVAPAQVLVDAASDRGTYYLAGRYHALVDHHPLSLVDRADCRMEYREVVAEREEDAEQKEEDSHLQSRRRECKEDAHTCEECLGKVYEPGPEGPEDRCSEEDEREGGRNSSYEKQHARGRLPYQHPLLRIERKDIQDDGECCVDEEDCTPGVVSEPCAVVPLCLLELFDMTCFCIDCPDAWKQT